MSARRSSPILLGICALFLTLVAPAARADEAGPPPGPPPNPNLVPQMNPSMLFGPQRAATFGLGFGQIGNSYYLQLRTYLDLSLGPVGLGIAAPFNLLSPFPSPNPADKSSAYGGWLRSQDWPKPTTAQAISHYLSLIRSVRFGTPTDPLYVQYGQFFSYSLGHGTIIDRYSNALDPDHPKPGLAFAINRQGWGISAFTDNIAYPSTTLLGGRAYVRPLALGDDPGFFAKRWAVGLSYVEDRSAPREPGTGRNAAEVGIDTEYRILSNSIIELVPYIDLNQQHTVQTAAGLHVGALTKFTLPVLSVVNFWARLELRAMQPGYIPSYFGTMYDVTRAQYQITQPGGNAFVVPQANAAKYLAPHGPLGMTALTKGIYGEAAADILHIVQAGGSLAGTPGVPNSNTLMLFATVPALSSFKISGYYLRSNFDGWSQIVKLDERSVISLVAMYDIWGPFWFVAQFNRHWLAEYNDELDPSHEHPTGYRGVNDTSFGFQAYMPF